MWKSLRICLVKDSAVLQHAGKPFVVFEAVLSASAGGSSRTCQVSPCNSGPCAQHGELPKPVTR